MHDTAPRADDDEPVATTVGAVTARARCDLIGTVRMVREIPRPAVALELVVDDGTGRIACRFAGRHTIGGVAVGRSLRVQGRAVELGGHLWLLNPAYELLDGIGCEGTASS